MQRPSTSLAVFLPKPLDEYFVPALRAALTGRDVRVWPDIGPHGDIGYALALAPPPGALASLPNLTCIVPIGAGIDHLATDPQLPDVPIIRGVQPDLVARMVEYVVLGVLQHHRQARRYREFQHRCEWRQLVPPAASERTVGILGLGTIGRACAQALGALGFRLRAWSRTEHVQAGVHCFSGEERLGDFLCGTEILVCLLPLTEQTRGLLNARRLAQLPRGASLINASRGAIVVDDDLIEALDTGHLEEATLDAFAVEPLPSSHRYWTHPQVTVTPHVASTVTPTAVASFLQSVLRRLEAGEALADLRVDLQRGY